MADAMTVKRCAELREACGSSRQSMTWKKWTLITTVLLFAVGGAVVWAFDISRNDAAQDRRIDNLEDVTQRVDVKLDEILRHVKK